METAGNNNTDKISVAVPPFAATEDGAEDDEAKEGEGASVLFHFRTAAASEELPRLETRKTTTNSQNDALSSNGTIRDGGESLLGSSVAPSAGGLTSRASSASPRILKRARAALPRPQASVLHVLGGRGGDGGVGDGHREEA